jgi:hypothetical protein
MKQYVILADRSNFAVQNMMNDHAAVGWEFEQLSTDTIMTTVVMSRIKPADPAHATRPSTEDIPTV